MTSDHLPVTHRAAARFAGRRRLCYQVRRPLRRMGYDEPRKAIKVSGSSSRVPVHLQVSNDLSVLALQVVTIGTE